MASEGQNEEQVERYVSALWTAISEAAPKLASGQPAVEAALVLHAIPFLIGFMMSGHPELRQKEKLNQFADVFAARLKTALRLAFAARDRGEITVESILRPKRTN